MASRTPSARKNVNRILVMILLLLFIINSPPFLIPFILANDIHCNYQIMNNWMSGGLFGKTFFCSG